MNYFDVYQHEVERVRDPQMPLEIVALGVAGEAGEVADLVKKIIGHKITEYKGKDPLLALEDEIGDVLWYLAAMCNLLGVSLGDVAEKNINKLYARYPNGFEHGGGIR